MKTIAIVVAGGSGTRFGAQVPKQFLALRGRPILMRTIEVFSTALSGREHEIIVTLPVNQFEQWQSMCREHHFSVPHRVVPGGDTRWHSVKNALDVIGDYTGVDVIAVHDGVRPLVSCDLISRCVGTACAQGSAIPVVTLNDSVRLMEENGSRAMDRSRLRAVQTPQVFDAGLLISAYKQPFDISFTDDASVVERMGSDIVLVEGEPSNIKITRPMDLVLAEYLLDDNA